MRIDAQSRPGKAFAEDLKSGAIVYDQNNGAFVKGRTRQEFLLTNQDRVVRCDHSANVLSFYSPDIKEFLPLNALQDGEALDRSRKLRKNDIVAKQTWGQFAGQAGMVAAEGAVAGVALGAVGGLLARGCLRHSASDARVSVPYSSSNVARSAGASGVAANASALVAAGPFHPGDLNPPGHININMPPAAGMNPGQAAQEGAAQGAFGAAGAIVGGCIGGPIGAVIGGVISAGA